MNKEKIVIIGLAFGQGLDNTPGLSNRTLAKVALNQARKYQADLVLQGEIYDAIDPYFPLGEIKGGGLGIFVVRPESDEYLDTYAVLVKAKERMRVEGYTSAILVAHQAHMWRVRLVAKKLGIKEYEKAKYDKIPYDPRSTQPWTRNALVFSLYDFSASVMYFFKRYIY